MLGDLQLGYLGVEVPDATALGFVALIREPTGRNWRTTKSVSSGSKFTINVTLGSGGISA